MLGNCQNNKLRLSDMTRSLKPTRTRDMYGTPLLLRRSDINVHKVVVFMPMQWHLLIGSLSWSASLTEFDLSYCFADNFLFFISGLVSCLFAVQHCGIWEFKSLACTVFSLKNPGLLLTGLLKKNEKHIKKTIQQFSQKIHIVIHYK